MERQAYPGAVSGRDGIIPYFGAVLRAASLPEERYWRACQYRILPYAPHGQAAVVVLPRSLRVRALLAMEGLVQFIMLSHQRIMLLREGGMLALQAFQGGFLLGELAL